MKNISNKIISSLALLGLVVACGQDKNSGKAGSGASGQLPQEEVREETNHTTVPVDGSDIDGHYLAPFITLNPQVNGTIPGSVSFVRKEDRLFAYLRLFAGAPKVWHQQKVYTGTRCPTMADDKNGDSYIDINEAEAVLGKVLIPLDADLNTQMSGRNFYPVGDLSGSYHYERVVSFKRFLADLRGTDKQPEDNIIKLAPDEPFSIEGKTVMIQGTAETIVYPETVGSSLRYKPFQTLPIACGIFKKVATTPGRSDDGTIPGPVADVEEGQDRPAPEDTPTSGGTTTGTSTGGTNETESGETETRDENGNSSRDRGEEENTGNTEITDETPDPVTVGT